MEPFRNPSSATASPAAMRLDAPPVVRVEFYGIPRARAGVEATTVEADTLGEALTALAARYPDFARACLDEGGALATACLANVNGRQFTRDAATLLAAGDVVLLLSADVGG